MGKSHRLRSGDVRAIYRLVGECRELGADSLSWRTHLADEICRLVGAQVGYVSETDTGGIAQAVSIGWISTDDRLLWQLYMQEQRYEQDSVIQRLMPCLASLGTCLREQVVRDRNWYNSTLFRDYFTPARIDDAIFSARPLFEGLVFLAIQRPLGDRRFAPRQCQLVRLCHDEICRLEGSALTTARDPSVSRLSPRLRQVLSALLDGDSEKQVGLRLRLRPDTVREYVVAIYRHFGARTRAELMAYFLRRSQLRLPDAGPSGAAWSRDQS